MSAAQRVGSGFHRLGSSVSAMRLLNLGRNCLLALMLMACFASSAEAQVAVDINSDTARRAADTKTLDDLAVNDTALFWGNAFCVQDNALYMPGWTEPLNLATGGYAVTGAVALRVEVLPGKKLRGRFVDAAQAQKIAQGDTAAPSNMTKGDYNKVVIDKIEALFHGGYLFGTQLCEEAQRQNPLRKLNLFAVESLNGYTKLSDLLASVTGGSTSASKANAPSPSP